MTSRLTTLTFDANDALGLARFWAAASHWEITDESDEGVELHPTDGTSFSFDFIGVPESKTGKNRIHPELVCESLGHRTEMVDRLVALGARPVDVGQPQDAEHVVLADPEGNEFCVLLRGDFFATTGLLGALAFEPAHPAVGYFWSEAIGWPIVYDQNGDTAVRDPSGHGPFITFGPPVHKEKTTKNRLHLDIAPLEGEDQATEVERLIGHGASRVDIGQGDVPWVVMADPEGNEFCVLTPR